MIFDGDRDKLGEYIREMANLMGLRDWSIILMQDPPEDPEYAACISLIFGQRRARLYVATNWMHRDPEIFRHTIAHELLHCHINPIEMGLSCIRNGIGDVLYYTVYNFTHDRTEHAVDAIATAWAETLPLPVLDEAEDAACVAAMRAGESLRGMRLCGRSSPSTEVRDGETDQERQRHGGRTQEVRQQQEQPEQDGLVPGHGPQERHERDQAARPR